MTISTLTFLADVLLFKHDVSRTERALFLRYVDGGRCLLPSTATVEHDIITSFALVFATPLSQRTGVQKIKKHDTRYTDFVP